MCQWGSHDAYGLGAFDHIEPIWGVYSDNPLNETNVTIYDGDYLVLSSNYAPDGNANLGYFRTFNSMTDNKTMDGNCKNAGDVSGLNE